MPAKVYYCPVSLDPAGIPDARTLVEPIHRLSDKLGLTGNGGSGWGIKVELGPPNRPAAVDPAWARAVAEDLGGGAGRRIPAGTFAFDTPSITVRGLETGNNLEAQAQAKGYALQGAEFPFRSAEPGDSGPEVLPWPEGPGGPASYRMAPALEKTSGLCFLNPIRPHPHLGFQGAVAAQGLGLADRSTKLRLHQDIRPRVDTPLCAGCGSCLAVCIYDAIVIQAGRAVIDHQKCTGCGECMNVCFMAGIHPDEAEGIVRFQRRLADAGEAIRKALPAVGTGAHFNLLFRMDRDLLVRRNRQRERVGDLGILASCDPVAADQATLDLIRDRMGGRLREWSGFATDPSVLLDRAEELDLGTREYRLTEIPAQD